MNSGTQNTVAPPDNPVLSCLLCCKHTYLYMSSVATGEKHCPVLPRNAIINLCWQMKLDYKEIPEQCTRQMFSFCKPCIVRLSWLGMYNTQQNKEGLADMVKRIRNAVLESEYLLKREEQIPPDAAMEAQKFTKLREMIITAYREEWMLDQKSKSKDAQFAGEEEDQLSLDTNGLVDALKASLQKCNHTVVNTPETRKAVDCICTQILPSIQNQSGQSLTPQLKFKLHYMRHVHKKFCLMANDNKQ